MAINLLDTSHYYLNPYAIPDLIIAIAILIIPMQVLIRGKFNQVAVTLALGGIVITIWLTSNFLAYSATKEAVAIWWAKAAYLGLPFIPAAMYHFTVAMLRIGKRHYKIVRACWILSAIFSALAISTDFFINGVRIFPWGFNPKSSPQGIVLIVYMLILFGLSFRHLWVAQKKTLPDSIRHRRIKSLFLALGIGSFGLVDYLPAFGFPVYPFGFFPVFIALCFIEWSISKYRLVDITPRFAAQAIIDTMKDSLLVLDAKGVIRLVNKSTTQLLGHTERNLVGKQISSIFGSTEFVNHMASPAGDGMVRNSEFFYAHPNGEKLIIDLSISLMKEYPDQLLAYVLIARDITTLKQTEIALRKAHDDLELRVEERSAELKNANEQMAREIDERKKIEEDLRNSESHLSAMLEASPDFIIMVDREERLLFMNQNAVALLEVKLQDVLRRKQSEVFPKDIAAENNSGMQKVFESGELLSSRTGIFKTGMAELWFDVVFAPIRGDNETVAAVLVVGRDVTLQKKAEGELFKTQKLESLGIVAGGIAHDFNNILTAILGNISLAKLHLTPEDVTYQELERAEKASLHARELTQQLLTFSRGGAPIKKTISLERVVRDAAGFALSGSNVSCDIRHAEGLWSIEADEGQIEQVFNNMVINACQAMPNGGTLRIGAENMIIGQESMMSLPAGKYVKVTVEDEGIGIPEEHLQKIFDPYFTTKQKGSGLGLAVTYSIIRNHGGCISARSKVGFGTAFEIYLPASGPDNHEEEHEAAAQSLAGKGRVLIMDDEEIVRDVLSEMLMAIGYCVAATNDGAEAIEMYTKEKESGKPFDIVIMDLTVPGGMGGKETMGRLLKIDNEVKAIVSSGYSNDPIMAKYGEYGFKAVIEKPYTINNLSKTLYKVATG